MIVICTGLFVSLVRVSVIILPIVVMFVVRTMYVHSGVAMIVSVVESRPMEESKFSLESFCVCSLHPLLSGGVMNILIVTCNPARV